MNPQQPDLQRVLADLDARLGRVSAELAEVRAGLASLGRLGPEHVQTQRPQPHHPMPGQSQPGPHQPPAGPWRPGHPVHPGGPGQYPHPVQPGYPGEPAPARASRISAATVIAAIGGAVMLAGIVFLLVVAIQAGLFPPIVRVIAAAILAAVLVGLGLVLQSRHKPTEDRPVNPGALALVGTGLAAGMLDVIASATLYQWIPVPAAYMFVGGLALAGMALAQRWSSRLLAILTSAGTMLLAPALSSGIELPIFLAIIGVATAVLAAELGTVVRVVWSVPPAFMIAGYLTTTATRSRGEQIALIATALVFAAVAVGVAWFDTVRRSPSIDNAALVVVPTAIPLFLLPTLAVLWPGWPAGLILAAAYLAVAVLAGRGEQSKGMVLFASLTGAVGSALLLTTWGELGGRELTAFALTLTALAYVVAAGLWARRWVDWVAGVATTIALLVYLTVNQPQLALSERLAVREFSYWDVVAAFAMTALALAVTWWARRRLPGQGTRVVMIGAVVALLTLSAMVVAAGVVIGDLAGAARNGFLVAHLVVTVLWICCAAWLVLTPSPRIADARRLGFVLGGLALAKLLLLDLGTLPGLFRVLSFIVVGAVMLAVAVRYRGGSGRDDTGGPGPDRSFEPGPDYRSETEPSGSGSPT